MERVAFFSLVIATEQDLQMLQRVSHPFRIFLRLCTLPKGPTLKDTNTGMISTADG